MIVVCLNMIKLLFFLYLKNGNTHYGKKKQNNNAQTGLIENVTAVSKSYRMISKLSFSVIIHIVLHSPSLPHLYFLLIPPLNFIYSYKELLNIRTSDSKFYFPPHFHASKFNLILQDASFLHYLA